MKKNQLTHMFLDFRASCKCELHAKLCLCKSNLQDSLYVFLTLIVNLLLPILTGKD